MEYMAGGVRLEWLFNPQDQQVESCRQGRWVEVRDLPTELSGEEVLPGFILMLDRYPPQLNVIMPNPRLGVNFP